MPLLSYRQIRCPVLRVGCFASFLPALAAVLQKGPDFASPVQGAGPLLKVGRLDQVR
jgi:hypothetical protein